MAHEFVAKNGLVVLGNGGVSGSLIVAGGITGNLTGTASFANSASNAGTASYSAYATNINTAITVSWANSASAATSSSYASRTTTSSFGISSANADSSSFTSFATNAGTATTATTSTSSSFATSAISSSYAYSASWAGSASWAPSAPSSVAVSASWASASLSSSYAYSASWAGSASWAPGQPSSVAVSASWASASLSSSYAYSSSWAGSASWAPSVPSSVAISASWASSSLSSSWAPPYTASQILQWNFVNQPISLSLNFLPTQSAFASPVVVGDAIYLYGGFGGFQLSNSIWSASITDPTVVKNTKFILPVSGARWNPGLVQTIGSTIYFFGGDVASSSSAASSASNFILTASTTTPYLVGKSNNFLPVRLSGQNVFNLNGTLYMMFGRTGSTVFSSFSGTLYAPTSNPLSWSFGPDVTATTQSMRCVYGQSITIGDKLYIYGGYQPGSADNNSNNRVLTSSVTNPLVWGIGATGLPAWTDSPSLISIGDYHFWLGGGNSTSSNPGLVYAFSASAPFTPIFMGRLFELFDLGVSWANQGMAVVALPPSVFTGSSLRTVICTYGNGDNSGIIADGIYVAYANSTIVSSSKNLYDYSNNSPTTPSVTNIPSPNEFASFAGYACQSGMLKATTTVINPPYQQGLMFWDTSSATWTYYNDSPEMVINIGASDVFNAVNPSATIHIPNGSVVYISGSTSGFPNVFLSCADSSGSRGRVDGVTTTIISASRAGYVSSFGKVSRVNLSLAAGSDLWLHQTISGSFQLTPPTLPYEAVKVGTCLTTGSVAGTGVIFVSITAPPTNTSYSSSFSSFAKTASYMPSLSGLVFSKGVNFFDPIGLAGTASLSQSMVIWRAPFNCTASNIWVNKIGGNNANTAVVHVRKNYATNLTSNSINITASNQFIGATTFVAGANFFSTGDTLDTILLTSSLFPQQVIVQVDFARQ